MRVCEYLFNVITTVVHLCSCPNSQIYCSSLEIYIFGTVRFDISLLLNTTVDLRQASQDVIEVYTFSFISRGITRVSG